MAASKWVLTNILPTTYPKDPQGPSNGRVNEPGFRRDKVLKIASFEGPMILRVLSWG